MDRIKVIKIDVKNETISDMVIENTSESFIYEIGCKKFSVYRFDRNNVIFLDEKGVYDDKGEYVICELADCNALIMGVDVSTSEILDTTLKASVLRKEMLMLFAS